MTDFTPAATRYRRRLIVGSLALIALSVPAMIHSAASIATLRNIPAEWLPETLPLRKDFLQFVVRFGITDVVLVSWPGCELDHPSLRDVRDYLRPRSIEMVGDDPSENASDQPPLDWFRDGGMVRDELSGPPLRAGPRAAISRLAGSMVGPDGRQTCVMLSLAPHTSPDHRHILPELRRGIAAAAGVDPGEVAMVGGPVDGAEVDAKAIQTINLYALPSSLVAMLICWACLRSLLMTGVVVGTAVVGQGMTLASIYYAGLTMNAVLIVLPPLVFVLTVSAGIHLCNYYRDLASESYEGPDCDAIADLNCRARWASAAVRRGLRPCVLATATTVVGLLSLTMVRLQPVRVFGLAGAGGIVMTLLLLLWILPGAMIYSRPKRGATRSEPVPGTRRLGDLTASSPWLVVSVFAVLTLVASVGLTNLRTSVSVPAMFEPESDLRSSYRWFEQQVGATLSGDVLVDFDDDVALLDQYEIVARLHAKLRKIESIGGVMSAANFLPAPPQGGSVSAVVHRSVIKSTLQNPQSPIHAMGFLSRQGFSPTWRIGLRIFQTDATSGEKPGEFDQLIRRIQAIGDEQVDTRGSVSVTGHFVIVEQTQRLLLSDLFTSFLAAFTVIAGIMMVHLRSILGGLIAMIPNVVPALVLFGWMGHTATPLDIGSVMTASVALGIAVDDTVHLLARFRSLRAGGLDRQAAAGEAIRQCGWAMLQTTVVCGLSLLVYGLSDFIPTQRFALFMLALLAIAYAGASLLLPALMRTRLGDYLCRNASR